MTEGTSLALSQRTHQAADRIIARYPQPRSAILPLLYLVQAEQGYITHEGLAFCAEKVGLTKAEVQAVQTYYEMFERQPVGDWLLTVCTNFSCKVRGAQQIFERWLEILGGHQDTETGVAVKHLECLGNCEDAPVVQVNYQNYPRMTVEGAEQLLAAARRGQLPPSVSGMVPETFKEVCWRLAGAEDSPRIHHEQVRAAEADMTAFPQPPGQRIFEEIKDIGGVGARRPGPEVGDPGPRHDEAEGDGRAREGPGSLPGEPAAHGRPSAERVPQGQDASSDSAQIPASDEEPIDERGGPPDTGDSGEGEARAGGQEQQGASGAQQPQEASERTGSDESAGDGVQPGEEE